MCPCLMILQSSSLLFRSANEFHDSPVSAEALKTCVFLIIRTALQVLLNDVHIYPSSLPASQPSSLLPVFTPNASANMLLTPPPHNPPDPDPRLPPDQNATPTIKLKSSPRYNGLSVSVIRRHL
ncbi:hypothetical protein B9479_005568 [Cryptococcus floricola]|uniref:Uncharacterized protein n=1 Tax=Cryptococcus floricola TaxID=2591691 RepID=A0A5D3AQG6_9TREE|nr:hypothetical protein B9479_005568 [Cryptococcus floricola]